MPSRAASAGCISTVGRPSRLRELGISVKLVLRNCAPAPSPGGTDAPAWPHRSPPCGRAALACVPSPAQARASPAQNETACPAVETRRGNAPPRTAARHRPSALAAPSPHPASRRQQRRVDDLHRSHLETAMLAPSRAARPCSTSWFDRHSPGGSISFGADLDMAVSTGLIQIVVLHEHRRRQHDIRPARRFRHELLVHARRTDHRAGNRGARDCCRAHTVSGFCSGSASRAPADHRAAPSRSPVSTLPIRLMSRCGSFGQSRPGPRSASCPSGTCRGLIHSAPPPSCCHLPVTVGRQLTACMFAAPLRDRAKP